MDVIAGKTLEYVANDSRASEVRQGVGPPGAGRFRAVPPVEQLCGAVLAAGEDEMSLLGFAAHELKNPLTSIKLAVRFLQNGDNHSFDTDVQEICGDIESSVEQMHKLISRLLEHHRVQHAVNTSACEMVHVDDCVKGAVRRFKHQLRAKELLVEIHRLATDVKFFGQASGLAHVLNNLLANAVRFSPVAGRIDVTIGMCREAETERPRGVITIRDEGPGVKQADRQRIFGMFERSVSQAENEGSSDGLGLALCRCIMRRMSGDVRLERSAGRGAAFSIVLPGGGRDSPTVKIKQMRRGGTNIVPAPEPDSAASKPG